MRIALPLEYAAASLGMLTFAFIFKEIISSLFHRYMDMNPGVTLKLTLLQSLNLCEIGLSGLSRTLFHDACTPQLLF